MGTSPAILWLWLGCTKPLHFFFVRWEGKSVRKSKISVNAFQKAHGKLIARILQVSYISQSELEFQDVSHIFFSSLSICTIKNCHVNLIAVISGDDRILQALDEIFSAQPQRCLINLSLIVAQLKVFFLFIQISHAYVNDSLGWVFQVGSHWEVEDVICRVTSIAVILDWLLPCPRGLVPAVAFHHRPASHRFVDVYKWRQATLLNQSWKNIILVNIGLISVTQLDLLLFMQAK